MKRVLKFLGIIAILIAAVCYLFTSCDKLRMPSYGEHPDSVYVADQIESAINPYFIHVADVKEFQTRLIEEYSVDQTFRELPPDVLENVSTVCLRKRISINKRDIVQEYLANRAVYDNLPQKEAPPVKQTKPDSVIEKPATTISYRYEIDTVDGTAVRTLVKEERTRE